MAKILYAPTEDFIKLERTKLAADVSAGSNITLVLENNDSLANNDFIVIGYEGNELAELEQINAAVSGSTDVRVATLKFNHKKGENVTKYRYNQRKFYGSLTAGGSYVELTGDGSPKAIQPDDPQGTLLEYTGSTYLYFKATYYNSTGAVETDLADSVEVEGDESKRYATIYAIRKHAGLAGNAFYSDGRIEVKRRQAENEIDSALYARYTLPLTFVSPLISQICELLAAGYIDFEEFGGDGEGVKWLGEARSLLKGLADGTRRLIGVDGTELTTNTKVDVLSGYPDGTILEGASDDRHFELGDKY